MVLNKKELDYLDYLLVQNIQDIKDIMRDIKEPFEKFEVKKDLDFANQLLIRIRLISASSQVKKKTY